MSKAPPQNQPPNGPLGNDELVAADDAIIGKAFRWSIIVFAVVGAAIAGTIWMLSRPDDGPAVVESTFVAPQMVTKTITPPTVRFTDITASAGIDFIHTSGATGEKLLPESMGSGCAFLDYDGDGDQDLFFVNATAWPGSATGGQAPATQRLYANDGTGRFTDVTQAAGLDVSFYGTGAAVGDYDNDGDPDLFIAAVGANRLFRNDDGRFTDVTPTAGVAGDAQAWSTTAGFVDYDNDGRLDLFVCNYVRWSREIDIAVDYRLLGVGRAYGPPKNFEGSHSSLYHNNGDGTFTDVSAQSGIQVTNPATGAAVGKALGVRFVDLGDNGLMDIIVANDTVANFLLKNKGGGVFEDIGGVSGLAFDNMGAATGAMGIDAAHYRNDAALGVVIGNFANEMTSLYTADASPWQFTDVAIAEGIGAASRRALSFGLFFFDYDLDGRLDLLQANGHLEEEINRVQPSQHYHQPAQLFWNCGPDQTSCFILAAADTTGDLATPIVGRGSAYADIDGDGDLDVVFTQTGEAPLLLRNDQALGNHWLRVLPVGTTCNRDAIGAVVQAVIGDRTLTRQVSPTRSYQSQVERPVTFGLGRADRVDRLLIRWPDGTRDELTNVPADRLITVKQGDAPTGRS